MHSFFLLLVQYIRKKPICVKDKLHQKQHQCTSLFIITTKLLLTSKCTIRALNVNSTQWGGTEVLKKQNHNRQKSDLRFRLTWSLLFIMCWKSDLLFMCESTLPGRWEEERGIGGRGCLAWKYLNENSPLQQAHNRRPCLRDLTWISFIYSIFWMCLNWL